MEILVYSENLLGSSGGAEIYALKLAEILSENNLVSVLTVCNDSEANKAPENVLKKYNIKHLNVKTVYFKHKKNNYLELLNRVALWLKIGKIAKKCDIFLNCSHNRLIGFRKIQCVHLVHFPMNNYCHFLPAFIGKFMNNWYRKSYKLFISNSEFTKYHLLKEWNRESIVLNPPIVMSAVSADVLNSKKKQILMVGRIVKDKKLIEMIDFFYSVKDKKEFEDYTLLIVGNRDLSEIEYFNLLCSRQIPNRIRIVTDVSFDTLVNFYRESEFFLHAKGFMEDEFENPILMEHFGMTTVEAMANGCIPIVINKAGQKEIVENGKSGFLWNTLTELADSLSYIIGNDSLKKTLQINAVARAEHFLYPEFRTKVLEIFNRV